MRISISGGHFNSYLEIIHFPEKNCGLGIQLGWPSMCEVLSSVPSIIKRKKERKKRGADKPLGEGEAGAEAGYKHLEEC